jgi:hypothetical protein
MRKLILMVGLVAVAIACGSAADMVGEIMDSGVPDAGAQPTPKPVGKFVGYTNDAYRLNTNSQLPGEGGLFNTYAACQTDFGPTARICAVTEVLGTVDLPAPPPEGGAWMIADNLNNVPLCWNGSAGPSVLSPNGTFNSGNCENRRVLACCTVN